MFLFLRPKKLNLPGSDFYANAFYIHAVLYTGHLTVQCNQLGGSRE